MTLALSAVALGLVLVAGTSLALALHIYRSNRDVAREYGHIRELDAIHALFHDVLFELHQVDSVNAPARAATALQLCEGLARRLDQFAALHAGELDGRERERIRAVVSELRRFGDGVQAIARRMAASGHFSELDVQWLDDADRGVNRTVEELAAPDRLRISRLLERSQASLRAMVLLYVVVVMGGGLLVVAGSVAAKRSLADPLRELSEAAARIAQGRLDTRVPVRSPNEIGQLADAFNVMCDRLEAREQELRAAQAALEQKIGETQALYRLGTEVARLHQLDQVLEFLVRQAHELLRADAAALCQRGPADQGLGLEATSGPADAFRAGAEAEPVPFIRPAYARAHLSARLRLGDEDMGVMWVACREPRTFGSDEAELLAGVATHAAIAIERVRLSDEVRRLAAEQERSRLAREMHDGLAQSLGLLHLKLQHTLPRASGVPAVAEALRDMAFVAGEAYEDVRQSIFELRTAASRGMGLVDTLGEYLHEFTGQTGIVVELAVPGGALERLPPASEVQAVRIIQEALTNVRKHSQADRACVSLWREGAWLRVAVQDGGRGWDAAAPTDRLHFGLQTMRERAEAAGGRLEIDTAPGRGTRILASLPAGLA